MPIIMPKDTAEALGPKAENCKSRSLFLCRFADPAAKDAGDRQPRREWFDALLEKARPSLSGTRETFGSLIPARGLRLNSSMPSSNPGSW
jgi:hypothetical protein